MESQFLKPPGETQIASRNRRVKLQYLTEERERLLVRVFGRFEKMWVRDIGIPLQYVALKDLFVQIFRRFSYVLVR